jgi:hypothetical protein
MVEIRKAPTGRDIIGMGVAHPSKKLGIPIKP